MCTGFNCSDITAAQAPEIVWSISGLRFVESYMVREPHARRTVHTETCVDSFGLLSETQEGSRDIELGFSQRLLDSSNQGLYLI